MLERDECHTLRIVTFQWLHLHQNYWAVISVAHADTTSASSESEPSVSQHWRSLDDAAAPNNAKPGPADKTSLGVDLTRLSAGREVQELLAENGRRLLRES